MRVLIENYRNLTAGHCGTGSMRNLLYHYTGLELEEGVVFGLGSGLDTVYFSYEQDNPPYMLFGRGSTFECDVAANLGVDYRETIQPDDDLAWEEVREEVIAGRPTMLSGDIYYLDYRKFKVHFPSHRFVLLGFDDERDEVYVADRTDEETQTCSSAAVRLSRNPPVGLSTFNAWGKFHSTEIRKPLPDACLDALRTTPHRMLGEDHSQYALMQACRRDDDGSRAVGLAGLELLLQEFGTWHDRSDAEVHLRYLVNAIVKFGTGGGFFRDHFAAFMRWSGVLRPDRVDAACVDLAEDSARQWNALAAQIQFALDQGLPPDFWPQTADGLTSILERERRLFERLDHMLA